MWSEALAARDGAERNPSVTIYRRQRGESGMPYRQNLRPGQSLQDYGYLENKSLTHPSERRKEVHVIVRRGRDVDYEEKEGSPFIDQDIRRDHPGEPWQQIQDGFFKPLNPNDPEFWEGTGLSPPIRHGGASGTGHGSGPGGGSDDDAADGPEFERRLAELMQQLIDGELISP